MIKERDIMKKILIAVCVIFSASCIFSVEGVSESALFNDITCSNNIITIATDKPAKYNIFEITNPSRLVIDLDNTEHNAAKKELVVNSAIVERIRSGQFQNEPSKITRIVVVLRKTARYKAAAKGNEIILTLLPDGNGGQDAKNETASAVKTAVKQETKAAVKADKKSPNGGAKASNGGKTAKKEFGVVLPKTPVTLEYQEADIRDVLQVMSIRSGVNIICGSDVTGDITISLTDVPFDQAFRTILSLKSLTFINVGDNIIRVLTPTQLTAERSQAVTFTKIFPLNYASADDIKVNIDKVRGIEGRKGITDVDLRTNSLVITDTIDGINSCEELIQQLDVKPLQVMIEARVVDIRLDSLSEIGVNWSSENMALKAGTGVTVAGRTGTVGSAIGVVTPTRTGSEVTGTSVKSSLGTPASGGLFNFGVVNGKDIMNLTLGAMITDGKAKVLSAPKVTTINNKEARLLAGEKMPFKTTTVSQGIQSESWSYIDVGVKLTVTPTISKSGSVLLKVHPEVGVPSAGVAGGAPPVRTRETEVTVMVQNNDTLVIGGLIDENDITTIQKIPGLGDLPILGFLFRYNSTSKARTELVVFITPKIIED